MPPTISSQARFLDERGKAFEAPGLFRKSRSCHPAACGHWGPSTRRDLEAGRRSALRIKTASGLGGAPTEGPAPRGGNVPRRAREAAGHGRGRTLAQRAFLAASLGAPRLRTRGGEGVGLHEDRRDGAPIVGLLRLEAWFEIPRGSNGSRSGDPSLARWWYPVVAALGSARSRSGTSTSGCWERPP